MNQWRTVLPGELRPGPGVRIVAVAESWRSRDAIEAEATVRGGSGLCVRPALPISRLYRFSHFAWLAAGGGSHERTRLRNGIL